MFRGIEQRLKAEMEALIAPAMDGLEVEITAKPDRQYAAWIGGSILASLATFQHLWVTRTEYKETGMVAVQAMHDK